jgi:ATP-binding cassette subfamily B (MDR/TAP) protein 1
MGSELSEKGDSATAPAPTTDERASNNASLTPANSKPEVAGVETPSDQELDLKKLDSHVINVKPENEDPFKHLPPDEAAILKRQVDVPQVKTGYLDLYRYATLTDKIIIVISTICAIAGGAALPLMTVVFGNLSGNMQGFFIGQSSAAEFEDILASNVLYFVYLAIGEFVTVYIATVGFIYIGEHISSKVRERYLEACMRQNIGFFDKLGAGEITTRITADTNLVQDGISEKVGLTITAVATFASAFVIGFIKYWKLTLILTSTVVAITLVMSGSSIFIIKYQKKALESYAEGGTVAEEVISSIRNATAFGTQEKLARQYDMHLAEAEKWGYKTKTVLGFMVGGMMGIVYLNYGLAFWQGSVMLTNGETDLTKVLTVLLAIMIGAFAFGNVAPNAQAFTTAVSAAAKIYNTIDRASPLDPSSETGAKLESVQGHIELRNIKMIYPSRPEVTVMHEVNLVIPAGKTTALVGASGSGKSTIVGLVERFYDPVQGTVLLDGHELHTLNLRWLRSQISLVAQEPVLFGTTIMKNILHGLIGTKFENEPLEERKARAIEAAKMANAHDFITALPEGYETNVGERGFLLSGGQKQRIAIARAMISDPKILLLDEATSALDTKSEGVVQAALEVAAQGRTTITIAHRLSTIKDADNIVVMQEGRIVEQGTHDQLLEQQGAYWRLVEAQKITAVNELTEEEQAEQDVIDAEDEKLIRQASRASQPGGYEADPDDERIALERRPSEKSVSSLVMQKRLPEEERDYSLWTLIKVIFGFNKKEWKLMLLGLFWSIICGGGNPTQALFFAKLILILALSGTPGYPKEETLHDANFWNLMYLMLGIVQFLAFSIQGWAFAYCSERLIHRVRNDAFRTMLRQDIAFFDKDENTAGALTSFLSTETTHIAGLSGVTLGTLLTVITTLVAALTLSIAIGWKLSLVVASTVPILLGCGFARFWVLARFQNRSKKAYESSASFACEATSAIRTVASLTREDDVLAAYRSQLQSQGKKSLISVSKSSLLYASSQSLTFLVMALGFWYGGRLLARQEYGIFQFFLCFSAIIFGAQSAGTIFSFAPDMGKAKEAARSLKVLFDRQPAIDSWSTDGEVLESMEGTIEFVSTFQLLIPCNSELTML